MVWSFTAFLSALRISSCPFTSISHKGMMLKILHTADVQLVAPFGFLGSKGAQHRHQLLITFERTVRLAATGEYDLLLVAGDLFYSNSPSRETVNTVVSHLASLRIPVCILPGDGDCYDEKSIYRRTRFSDNVHVLTEQPTYHEFPNLELTVAGNPTMSRHGNTPPLRGITRSGGQRWFLAMAHGNLQLAGNAGRSERPIYAQDLSACNANYVALGEWHSFADYSQGGSGKAFYSGAPEPTAVTHKGAGHVARIIISEDGVDVRPIRVGSIEARIVKLNISGFTVADTVRKIETLSDPDLMLSVTLTGQRTIEQIIEPRAIEDTLGDAFYSIQVQDETTIALDGIDPTIYVHSQVLSRYVQMLTKEIEAAKTPRQRRIAEQALQLGFALLQGEKVFA
jgi:DNA repair exonuclease SbcCD nuclease subunit